MKKRLFLLPLLFLFCLNFENVKASHVMGVDVTYECLNNCTIRVHFRTYRDCSGASGISNNINFQANTGCNFTGGPPPVTPWSPEQRTEVTPVCPTTPTRCTTPGATINGVQELYWFRDYNICATPNCIYTITWSTCCRNPAITSLVNGGSSSIYTGSTTLNTGITPCNSSPQFTNKPVPYLCAGQPYTFNQGAYDPDGDSLAYALGPCYSSATNQVNYNTAGGYSATAPMGPTWSVTINSTTGDITVAPNTAGNVAVGVLCVYVQEWRNGTLLNTIVRDIQMTVINCPNNVQPSSNGVTNISGGTINSAWNVTVCQGTQLQFNIPIIDPDNGQTQTVYWNSNITGATFTQLGNSSIRDTIIGSTPTSVFTWTPTAQGTYTFLVTMRDDACPIVGQNQYTITINVNGGLLGSSVTGTPTGCTNVQFTANAGTGGTGPYTYQWLGDGNLSINPNANQATLNHTYPGPGSYVYTCIITDAFGCQGIVVDTITIANGPTADAGPNISMCSGYTVQLGAAPMNNHSYSWFPAGLVSNSAISNPSLTYTNTGTAPDTLNFVLSATEGFCTSVDYVTVIVYPTPQATIAGNTNICLGDSTTLTASGGTSFVWSTGDTSQSIRVGPTSQTTYTVTVNGSGCASLPAAATITVSTGPVGQITGVDSVCYGDAATLTAVGGTSWVWSTGSTSQTVTIGNILRDTTVTVIPANGGCIGAPISYTVHVHEKPIADFVPSVQCFEDITDFTDASIMNTGPITNWTWDFGDVNSGLNNFSNSQNPTHTYTAPGTYTATLIVTAYNGCMDTVTQQVVVNPLPEAEFTWEKVCIGEEMVFNNSSTGQVVSWDWRMGDGTRYTDPNPRHTYTSPGLYNVILNVTDNNGCTDTRTQTVIVHPRATPSFTVDFSCFNTIAHFTSTSTLNDPLGTTMDAYSWDFGDPNSGTNNTSNDINPTHVYSGGSGRYFVSLTVTTSQGCTETIVQEVIVPVTQLLETHFDTICPGYSAFLSVDNFVQDAIIEWYAAPNSGEPFHTGRNYTTPPLNNNQTYYVSLYTPLDGCRSPRFPIVAAVHPGVSVEFDVNRTELQIPNAIAEFNITRVISPTGVNIASYLWDFGDGNTSTQMNPVHEYTQPGVYDVTLTITNEFGCEITYFIENWIEVLENVRIYIPNAFSPNNDDVNDQFYVVSTLITDMTVSIYDRWGKLIYQSNDMNFRWDGKDAANTELPEGVYTYLVEATAWNGQNIKKSGTLTLIR